jgi:hypothetical protein
MSGKSLIYFTTNPYFDTELYCKFHIFVGLKACNFMYLCQVQEVIKVAEKELGFGKGYTFRL